MSHYVIGLQASPWQPVVEQISGHAQWVSLESAQEYRPRQHDHALGFFGLTEVQLLQRCDVEVYAFTVDALHRQRVATAPPPDRASAAPSHPEAPAALAPVVVRPSAPRGRLAAAHFNRVHRAAIGLAAN